MKKRFLQEKDLKRSKKIASTESSVVYKLNDGSILKIYNPSIIGLQKIIGLDVEAKILSAQPLNQSPEILVPSSAVYDQNGIFRGYTMQCANGIDFNTYDEQLTLEERKDLQKYTEIHHKLESVLRRNPNIVFPDFCTCDNIFIDSRNNIQFIDYDGLQIGGHKSISLSTSLGGIQEHITNPKYFTPNQMFTKELDKKSSIYLFYLTAFNIDLTNVGKINPFTGKLITLDDIFACLNLDDPDLCHKTHKLFVDNQPNEFLGEDILNLSERYDVKILDYRNNCCIKKLVKKK